MMSHMSEPKPPGFKLNGVKSVAEMLNHLDSANRTRILSELEARDPELAEKIKEHLFTFNDLLRIAKRDLQILLREVPHAKLALALRSIDEAFRKGFYANMSETAAKYLKEEIAASPPQRLSDIQNAQAEIVKLAQRLASEAKISIEFDHDPGNEGEPRVF